MKIFKTGTLLLSAVVLLPGAVFSQGIVKKAAEAAITATKTKTASAAKDVLFSGGEWVPSSTTGLETVLQKSIRKADISRQLAAHPLTLSEKNATNKQLELLNLVAKEIRRNPAVIFKKKFFLQRQTLNKLEIPVSVSEPLPVWGTPLRGKDVRTYVKEIETSFNNTYAALAAKVGQTPQKINVMSLLTSNTKELTLARGKDTKNKWKAFFNANKRAQFSWGFPGVDQINIVPANKALKSTHVLNSAPALIKRMPSTHRIEDVFDLAASETIVLNLTASERQNLLKYLSAAEELLGYDLLVAYVEKHHTFPVLSTQEITDFANYAKLDTYARKLLAKLIEKNLKVGTPLVDITSSQFVVGFNLLDNLAKEKTKDLVASALEKARLGEEVNTTAVFTLVDYSVARFVARALSKQEYDVAIWLLLNPGENTVSRNLTDRLISRESTGHKLSETLPVVDAVAIANARLELLGQRIAKASAATTRYEKLVENCSQTIQEVKAGNGTSAFQQLQHYRLQREILDLKVTHLKSIIKKLNKEYNLVASDLATQSWK